MQRSKDIRPLFWQKHALTDMTSGEWEALCDGCGKCCLNKLEEYDSHRYLYTNISCHLQDCQTGYCKNYQNRKQFVPDCITLTPQKIPSFRWLPKTCAYRRLSENKDLPSWHPLITGRQSSVHEAGHSVAHRIISESLVPFEDWEDYVVDWAE